MKKNYRFISNIAAFVLKAVIQAVACIDKNEDLYNFTVDPDKSQTNSS